MYTIQDAYELAIITTIDEARFSVTEKTMMILGKCYLPGELFLLKSPQRRTTPEKYWEVVTKYNEYAVSSQDLGDTTTQDVQKLLTF